MKIPSINIYRIVSYYWFAQIIHSLEVSIRNWILVVSLRLLYVLFRNHSHLHHQCSSIRNHWDRKDNNREESKSFTDRICEWLPNWIFIFFLLLLFSKAMQESFPSKRTNEHSIYRNRKLMEKNIENYFIFSPSI